MSAGTFAGRALSSELRLAARTRAVLEAEGLVVTAVAVWAMLLALWLPALVAPDTWLALVDGRLVATSGIPHSDPFGALDARTRVDRSAMGSTPRALRARSSRRRLGGRLLRGGSRARRTLDRGRARAEAGRDSSQYGACALVPRDRRAVDGAGAHPKLRGRPVPGRVRTARARRAPATVAPRALGRTAADGLGEPSWLRRARSGSRRRSRRSPTAARTPSLRRRSVLLAVGSTCAVFASPYALDLPAYYRLMLIHPPFASAVTEWGPASFSKLSAIYFFTAFAGVALGVAQRSALTVFERWALPILLVASLSAMRNAIWFEFALAISLPRAFWIACGRRRSSSPRPCDASIGDWPSGWSRSRRRSSRFRWRPAGALDESVSAKCGSCGGPCGWTDRDGIRRRQALRLAALGATRPRRPHRL